MGNCSFKHDDETGVIENLQAPIRGTFDIFSSRYRTYREAKFCFSLCDWKGRVRPGLEGANAQDEAVLCTQRNVQS